MKRKDFGIIKKSFEDRGCVLLTTKYKNNKQKLKYICSNGHSCTTTWKDWDNGKGCNICSIEKGAKKRRMDFSIIKGGFEECGFSLITSENEYRNCDQKLDYICPNGHKHSISWHNWQSGWRCPYCYGNIKNTIEDIRTDLEKHDYILATNIYINCYTKLPLICPNGHKWSVTWINWCKGTRCPYCSGRTENAIEGIRGCVEKYGYTLATDVYVNYRTKLPLVCPNGHEWSVTLSNWKQGKRCPKCSDSGVSKWEKEVKMYVSSLNIDYIPNYRDKDFLCSPDTGRALEFDLWFPQLNKAIECNGIYWHSLKRRRFLDGVKRQFCNKSNIGLLVLTDQEWDEDIDCCKSKIQNFCQGGNI